MADNTPEALAVTQEDRHEAWTFVPRNSIAGQDYWGFFEGKYDSCQAVQAFARHRHHSEGRTGVSPPTERMEKILGATFVVSGEGRTGAGEAKREGDPAWLVEALETANRQAAEAARNQADEIASLREEIEYLKSRLPTRAEPQYQGDDNDGR